MKWFRNLIIYRLENTPDLTEQEWQDKLENDAFHPCLSDQPHSQGWACPAKNLNTGLSYHGNQSILFSLRKEERLLPAGVVNEALDEKVSEIEVKEDRRLGRKERSQLKEDIVFEMMPRAFTRSRYTNALLLTELGLLIVDSSSQTRAEELTIQLRKSLGSLKLSPLQVKDSTISLFTRWLSGELAIPSTLQFGHSCELRSTEESSSIVKFSHQDLTNGELQPHFDAGKVVVKLEFDWSERLSFLLTDNLEIKRLRFSDVLQEEAAQDGSADPAAEFDAKYILMSMEMIAFLPSLVEYFGGEDNAE